MSEGRGGFSFRDKLPELMLEALSVVLAVLAALAVDEWRETRSQHEMAERATAAVVAELRSNREEIGGNLDANLATLAAVRAARGASELPDEFDLNYEYSLVSDAAWETARMTQATQFMDLEDVRQLAALYELQALFERSRDQVMDFIMNVGAIIDESPEKIPSRAFPTLNSAVGMQQILLTTYDSTIARLEAPEA